MNDYLNGSRFQTPQSAKDFDSPYDIHSDAVQDIVQRGLAPFQVNTLNLGSASNSGSGATPPTQGEWIEFKQPGNHITLFGYDSNSASQANITAAFCEVLVQSNRPADNAEGFPLKHNRVISGPFDRFWVRWPAQAAANIKGKLIVHRYKHSLPINGEAST